MDDENKNFAKYPSLQDRVVLITYGASGVGEVLVEAFTLQGAQVVFLDTDDASASALIDRLSLNAAHGPVYLHCDRTDPVQLAKELAAILARFGTLDVVIHNAGDDPRDTSEDDTPEFRDRCDAVNRKHEAFAAQTIVPGIQWQGRNVILNMSSFCWMIPLPMIPSPGLPVYTTSKAAIVGLTRNLAQELEPHGIRVDCSFPGPVEAARQRRNGYTEDYMNQVLEQHSRKRILQPEEVVHLAHFLAGGDASEMTSKTNGCE